jgi:hypothetical protein
MAKKLSWLLLLCIVFPAGCEKPYEKKWSERPVIIEQPKSAVYNEDEEAAPLYIIAESPDGGTITYQWYKNDASNWVKIEGATESNYTPPTGYGKSNKYCCMVNNRIKNDVNGYSIYSDDAHITIIGSKFGKLSEFDKLLINGMTARLEQIYLMPGKNTIPIYDEPVAELFENENSFVNLIFQTTEYKGDCIMSGLYKGEEWTFSFYEIKGDVVAIEHGYGTNYWVQENVTTYYYELIESNNPYSPRIFVTNYDPGNFIYRYRGHDNILFGIKSYTVEDKWVETNLALEVLTKNGNALFEDGYFYMDTNGIYELGQRYTEPLTGAQVARIIQNGTAGIDYEIYFYNGHTTYKIGDNLYIPTIGNTYKYVGTTNQNGMINYYTYKYYRLKFKIL